MRNMLIYFNTSLQDKVLGRIHYALGTQGLLFLGTSETVGSMETPRLLGLKFDWQAAVHPHFYR